MAHSSLETRTTPREIAAYWLNQRRSGDMTPEDVRAFNVWLERDPRNRAAYRELERLWGAVGAAAGDPELMASREKDVRAADNRLRLRWAGFAAAVVGLIGAASLIALPPRSLPPAETGIGAFAQQLAHGPAEFRTSVGQRTTVTLPDHSVVTLDTDSILKVHDSKGERLVSLERGRAFFKVAKDPSRPFIVAAGDHRVRAIGTAFDVTVAPDKFEVTLVEGRVKIETLTPLLRKPVATAELTPGQRLEVVDDAPKLIRVDLPTATSWRNGRLTYVRSPLAAAVEEMNRYSDKKLVFRDGRVPDRSIIGVFKAGDVDKFAKALEMDGLATITAETDDVIELTPQ